MVDNYDIWHAAAVVVAAKTETKTGADAILQDILPYGTAAGIILAVLWCAKQFFGETLKQGGLRFSAWVYKGPRVLRGRRLRKYRKSIRENYRRHPLGFLRDQSIEISKLYVPLDHMEEGQRKNVYVAVRSHARTVILGAAGGGKSMLLKASMLRWSTTKRDSPITPILVELNRFNEAGSSVRQMAVESLRRNGVADGDALLMTSMSSGLICLLLDGLDEVAFQRRIAATNEIKTLAESYPRCQFVVTCRDAVYDGALSPTFDNQVKIAGFDDASIRRYLLLWFSSHDQHSGSRVRERVARLTAELRKNPAVLRLARSPLLLAMIATLHNADPGLGPSLTNSRADFYKEAIEHFLKRDYALYYSCGSRNDVGRSSLSSCDIRGDGWSG
jgi:predicted NACHT family NTPase